MNTKSQTDNTEWLSEILHELWESAQGKQGRIATKYKARLAIQAKLKEQDIKSRIDELGNVQLDYGHQTAQVWVDGKLVGILERLDQLRSLL